MGARMKSIGAQIKQLAALVDTDDLTEWEQEFVASIVLRTKNGSDTRSLTMRQVEIIPHIYRKHFGDIE